MVVGVSGMYSHFAPLIFRFPPFPAHAEHRGHLLSDLEPAIVPEEMIDDAADFKPADWDDREKIDDPEATKPEDWDEDAPAKIVDEDAVMPEGDNISQCYLYLLCSSFQFALLWLLFSWLSSFIIVMFFCRQFCRLIFFCLL